MPQREPKVRFKTPLSKILIEYLETHPMNQLDLAEYLNIGERTLRRWKNGEEVLTDAQELKRLAELLNVEPELLGVVSSVHLPLTLEQIDKALAHVWTLVAKARNYEARVAGEKLVKDLRAQITKEDNELLVRLARAHHVTGYVTSLNTHTNEVHKAIEHFEQMASIARLIHDDTLLNLALTYHGDMLRREGDIDEAITYLEAARDTTPLADVAARGNAIQLLGRAYVHRRDIDGFQRALAEAERLVGEIDSEQGSTNGLYCRGTVLEEYGRSYGTIGQMQKALAYLDEAEKELSPTMRWKILLMTTRAVTLIRGGEYHEGGELAIESAQLCRAHGNIRCLERVYGVQRYLERLSRDVGKISGDIREALDGPLGHWEVPTQG
ncbi:MAG: helix-turn-helix domain-containing protein [Ktedonobacteraceae bacterium]|nr:helix-turn-helix domain-containing protein [Ktedonobacteraceae bacterium]